MTIGGDGCGGWRNAASSLSKSHESIKADLMLEKSSES